MPSPFPGMDPYLEQFWGDVHTSFMVYARDQINEQLPSDLQARVEESLSVDVDDGWRVVYPDMHVVEGPRGGVAVRSSPAATAAEPLFIPSPDEPPTERHIEIIDRNSGHRVVTVIELLSPSNKVGEEGRRAYRRKQDEYRSGGVNLVEIDLVRQGTFILAVSEMRLPPALRRTNMVCVRRAGSSRGAEIYPAPLRDSLPNVAVPLRQSDPDVVLQLQPLIDECWRRGRYATIDYRSPPVPSLNEEDERWADELLRRTGLRAGPATG